jgi:hypothetical protein
MTMNLVLYLSLLIAGILFLVGGLFLTRSTWRDDIEPYGRRNFLFHIALHPGQFAKPDHLNAIRALNLIGGILLMGALIIVGYDILMVMERG